MNSPFILVWMALACASISFTLTKTPAFAWAQEIAPGAILKELWGCPYCMSHYVAAFLVGLVQPRPFTGAFIDFLLDTFIIVTLSMFAIQGIIAMGLFIQRLRSMNDDWPEN